jgi:hypothetical protein
MTETTKKTKAPAKPRATAKAKKEAGAGPELVTKTNPTREQIAELAHRFWAERGRQHGFAEQDWLRAERELMGLAS